MTASSAVLAALVKRKETELEQCVEQGSTLLDQLAANPSLLDQGGPHSFNAKLQTNQAESAALRSQLAELDIRVEAAKVREAEESRRAAAEQHRANVEAAAMAVARNLALRGTIGKEIDLVFKQLGTLLASLDQVNEEIHTNASTVARVALLDDPQPYAAAYATSDDGLRNGMAGNALASAIITHKIFDKGIRLPHMLREMSFTVHPETVEDAFARSTASSLRLLKDWLTRALGDSLSPAVRSALTGQPVPKRHDVNEHLIRHARGFAGSELHAGRDADYVERTAKAAEKARQEAIGLGYDEGESVARAGATAASTQGAADRLKRGG